MTTDRVTAYLEGLGLTNLSEVARETGRAYRTLQSYRRGERRPSKEAIGELAAYLRRRSDEFADAAQRLSDLGEEENRDG